MEDPLEMEVLMGDCIEQNCPFFSFATWLMKPEGNKKLWTRNMLNRLMYGYMVNMRLKSTINGQFSMYLY